MKDFITYLIGIPLLFLSCQKTPHSSSEIEVIDLSNSYNKENKLLLSDIAYDLTYIRLQTDSSCFVDRINNPLSDIKFSNDRLFINDGSQLLSFDFNGKFLNKIGKLGKGPGEFIHIDNFTILDTLVVIFSQAQQTAFLYTFDNKFINDININFWPKSLSSLNNKYMVFGNSKGFRNFSKYFTLSILDKRGTLINNLINNKWAEKIEIAPNITTQLYHYYDSLSYWEFQYDTIYRVIDEKRVIPRYYINPGKDKMPFELLLKSEISSNKTDAYVKIWRFIETKRYFFFRVGHKIHLKHIIYDKYNHQGYNVLFSQNETKYVFFENDIDGGLPFWPLGNVNGNKVFSLFYGNELKDYLKKSPLNNRFKVSKDKYNNLQDLANKVKIIDNPILMMVTLKE